MTSAVPEMNVVVVQTPVLPPEKGTEVSNCIRGDGIESEHREKNVGYTVSSGEVESLKHNVKLKRSRGTYEAGTVLSEKTRKLFPKEYERQARIRKLEHVGVHCLTCILIRPFVGERGMVVKI